MLPRILKEADAYEDTQALESHFLKLQRGHAIFAPNLSTKFVAGLGCYL